MWLLPTSCRSVAICCLLRWTVAAIFSILQVRIELAKFPEFSSDIEWSKALLAEQAVVIIPGTAFEFPGWFRTLLSAPRNVLQSAWQRIAAFCKEHYSP